MPGDAASEDGVASLVQGAADELDGIDLFCANAGWPGAAATPTEADWAASWQVNVMAHVRAARLLLPGWLERGSGHLICTVSAAGLLTMLGSAPYSVTKHAALGFAEWLAATYAHRGLTVQALCPMGVRTPMLAGISPAAEIILGETAIEPEEVADAVVEAIADGRFLILPHPDVARMYAGRATDTDRWLRGMNKLRSTQTETAGVGPVPGRRGPGSGGHAVPVDAGLPLPRTRSARTAARPPCGTAGRSGPPSWPRPRGRGRSPRW